MNSRLSLAALAFTLAASAAGATLHAQASPPSVMGPKRAARNAAAKVDAHTKAMTSPSEETPAGSPPQPQRTSRTKASSQPQPSKSQPAASQAVGASGTTAQRQQASGAVADSGTTTSVSQLGAKGDVSFRREVFSYDRSARRDPFLSLLASGELRPMLSDLKLVAVLYDPVGRSWAILRDLTSKEQYRVKVGQTLGRMRVTQIHPKSVTFAIEEIGFSREQTMSLNDNTKERER